MRKIMLALCIMLGLLILTTRAAYNAGFYHAVHVAVPSVMNDGTIEIDYGGEIHKYVR